jgi:hypothetical protein
MERPARTPWVAKCNMRYFANSPFALSRLISRSVARMPGRISPASDLMSWATAHSSSAISGRAACRLRCVGQTTPRLDAHHTSTKRNDRCSPLRRRLRAALLLAGVGSHRRRRAAGYRNQPSAGIRCWAADTTQCLQGRGRGQNGYGVLAGKPGNITVIARIWWLGHQYLEGELRQRAKWHN